MTETDRTTIPARPSGAGIGDVLRYHRGEWSTIAHPVTAPDPAGLAYEDWLRLGGYRPEQELGATGEGEFHLTVYGPDFDVMGQDQRREGAPMYLVDLSGGGHHSPTFAAQDAADLMDLIARWAPALRLAIEDQRHRRLTK